MAKLKETDLTLIADLIKFRIRHKPEFRLIFSELNI